MTKKTLKYYDATASFLQAPPTVQIHVLPIACLKKTIDAAVHTTPEANRSASDELSGVEDEGSQPYDLNRRQILAEAELS